MRMTTYVCGLALMFGVCVGAEEVPDQVTPGVRALSFSEWIAIEQEREEGEEEEVQQLFNSPEAVFKYELTYRTTHAGVFHNPISVGEFIVLEDGSTWKASKRDMSKIANWQPTDTVVITTNKQWFSSYMFCITNRNAGVSVKCNLHGGPVNFGICSHWIIAINPYTKEVCLEDGSLWNLSAFDAPILSKWLVNDTIIIGLNDGLRCESKPNILINVNTLTHAKANCTWQFSVHKAE